MHKFMIMIIITITYLLKSIGLHDT